MGSELTVVQALRLSDAYFYRRERWADEDPRTSFLVAVLNYGDRLTAVACIGREWSGTKGDLQRQEGIPLCPNGHPLIEFGPRCRLGLIEVQP